MNAPRRALIVIDVQQEYFEGLLPIQYPARDDSIANIAKAIDTAQEAGLPIAIIQHELPEEALVFAKGTPGYELHPDVAARFSTSWKHGTKAIASVFEDADVVGWLRENNVDTVTLVGYMTNNCVFGSAAGAEPLGLAAEVISDATGAVHLSNEIGTVSADQLHQTLLVVLHSNFAAVADTSTWQDAVAKGTSLPKSDLGSSILAGQAAFTAVSAS